MGEATSSPKWAQIIRVRLKPGTDERYREVLDRLHAAEQADSGLLRMTAARDQNDPSSVLMMIVFGSEADARAREDDPRRTEQLEAAREIMGEIFDGPPEFTDLEIIDDLVR